MRDGTGTRLHLLWGVLLAAVIMALRLRHVDINDYPLHWEWWMVMLGLVAWLFRTAWMLYREGK